MSERILGVVGGTGPESTIDYYRDLIAIWQARAPEESYPRVIINSVNGPRVFAALAAGTLEKVADEIVPALEQLAAAGVGTALVASNAGHLAFEHYAPRSPVPLIHIGDAARDAAIAGGMRRVALIGTRYVVEASMYPDRFRPAGIELVVPTEDELAWIHEIYLAELLPGVLLDTTRARLEEIVQRMRDQDGVDGLLLGGTELALILRDPTCAGVPVLNTARLHAAKGVDWLLGSSGSAERE
jgi:aspartate racemase